MDNKKLLQIKHHFPSYCKYVYPKYIFGEHLIKIMRALTDIDGGKLDRLILNLPPRAQASR